MVRAAAHPARQASPPLIADGVNPDEVRLLVERVAERSQAARRRGGQRPGDARPGAGHRGTAYPGLAARRERRRRPRRRAAGRSALSRRDGEEHALVQTLHSGVMIGEAARVSGASVRSLRFYEDEGLIVPGRCSNGYRDYCSSTIDRVVTIRSLLGSGLPVRLIKDVLPHVTEADAALLDAELLDEVRSYRDRIAVRITALSAQQSALDAFLEETAT